MDAKTILLVLCLLSPVLAVNNTPVRLVDGPDARVGRLEVYHSGQWGTVCDDSFDDADARVICKMMGLLTKDTPYFSPKHYPSAKYGQGTGRIWLDDVNCSGNETDISECKFHSNTWGASDCSHTEDVSVDCRPFWSNIRLVGGSGNADRGRVEVMFQDSNGVSQHGTICDRHFTNYDARVICNMVGHNTSYLNPVAYTGSLFGGGNGPIVLSDLSCKGTEDSVDTCPNFQWGKVGPSCDHSQDASVNCSVIYGNLYGGTFGNKEGLMRIYDRDTSRYHRVCTDVWNDAEATFVCKNLFSSSGSAYKDVTITGKAVSSGYFGDVFLTPGKILKFERNCRGFPFCIYEKTHTDSCKFYDIGLVCETSQQNSIRLVGGHNKQEGRVEILYNGQRGTLCSSNWGSTDAKVVCRTLGYWSTAPTIYSNSAAFGQGSGQTWNINPYCSGRERSFFDCQQAYHYGQVGSCSLSYVAGVNCTQTAVGSSNIRLSDGPGPWKGRLDIKYNNKWGSVCWDSWTPENTNIICKMLGYRNITSKGNGIAQSTTPLLISKLNCGGYETDIGYCTAEFDRDICSEKVVEIDCSGGVNVRLVNGSSPVDGEVEILVGGQWKKVCNEGWGQAEGNAICNMLGINATNPTVTTSFHNNTSAVDIGLNCSGWEAHIDQCKRTIPSTCLNASVARVSCSECVQVNKSSSGFIFSTNYPGTQYPPNTDCVYIIQPEHSSTGPNGLYKLKFDYMFISYGDKVDIYSGVPGKPLEHFQGYLNGNNIGKLKYLYAGSQFLVHFTSDDHSQANGFHATWSALEIEDVATVTCKPSNWDIRLEKSLLEAMYPGINASAIFLHSPRCTGRVEKGVIVFDYAYTENHCYTDRKITNTDVIYTSEIIYPYVEPSYPSVVFGHIWKIDVTCSLPNHGQIGIQIHPDHYLSSPAPTLNQVTPVHHSLNGTSTAVSLHFHFYSDPGFVHEISGNPIHATFGDEVYVTVTHDSVDNGLKMRLETCFSRPGSGNGPIVYLIVDGCAPTSMSHVISQDTHESRFSFKVFEYPDHDSFNAYVYCNATFCNVKDVSNKCNQGCYHSGPIFGRSLQEDMMMRSEATTGIFQGALVLRLFKSRKINFSKRSEQFQIPPKKG